METDFKAGRFGDGLVKGIEEIDKLLSQYCPIKKDDENELSNKTVIL